MKFFRQLMFNLRCKNEVYNGRTRREWIIDLNNLFNEVRDEKTILDSRFEMLKDNFLNSTIFNNEFDNKMFSDKKFMGILTKEIIEVRDKKKEVDQRFYNLYKCKTRFENERLPINRVIANDEIRKFMINNLSN